MLSPKPPDWKDAHHCAPSCFLLLHPKCFNTPVTLVLPHLSLSLLCSALGCFDAWWSSIPCSSPPSFLSIPVPAGPAMGLGGSMWGKHGAPVRIKRPQGSREGGLIHPAPEPGRAQSCCLWAIGGRSGESVR